MRRIARLLKVHPITVARKKRFLGLQAIEFNKKALSKLPASELMEIQFDDLITIEHTKLKQVSVSVIVTKKTRKIIGIDACRIPTSGLLAKKSVEKYGIRPNEHPATLRAVFEGLKGVIPAQATFTSDSHKDYAPILRSVFPSATHVQVLGERGCIAGQGELKKVAFDPLFSLNHTCAMLRANINRLVRRTWCTTKKLEALRWHLAIYAKYHNEQLTQVA